MYFAYFAHRKEYRLPINHVTICSHQQIYMYTTHVFSQLILRIIFLELIILKNSNRNINRNTARHFFGTAMNGRNLWIGCNAA